MIGLERHIVIANQALKTERTIETALKKLKKGDTFYYVDSNFHIIRYEYLMKYPFHNPANVKLLGEHIILNKNVDEPLRVHYKRLFDIVSQKCKTFEEAKALRVIKTQEFLDSIK